jgi:hypothetical protein
VFIQMVLLCSNTDSGTVNGNLNNRDLSNFYLDFRHVVL